MISWYLALGTHARVLHQPRPSRMACFDCLSEQVRGMKYSSLIRLDLPHFALSFHLSLAESLGDKNQGINQS